ncbi:hypothetical protein [Nocardia sp. NBC_00511]|uniref:hypothetical protein n=1 Tax=Nocardia sp. NBC_00511 TaxID=2903591 RepID=UPI0030E22DA9
MRVIKRSLVYSAADPELLAAERATIVVHRNPGGWQTRFRAYGVLVDGHEVARLRSGTTVEVSVLPGKHRVELTMDLLAASPVREFIVRSGQRRLLVNSPKRFLKALATIRGRDFLTLDLIPVSETAVSSPPPVMGKGAGIPKYGLVEVVHALASSPFDFLPDNADWGELAKAAVALGGRWSALVELAERKPTVLDYPALNETIGRLREQTGKELGTQAPPEFWRVVVGLVSRSCRLGVLGDEMIAARRLDSLWMNLSGDTPGTRAEELLWEGMAVHELDWYVGSDVWERALALITEADHFLSADAVDRAFCEAAMDVLL